MIGIRGRGYVNVFMPQVTWRNMCKDVAFQLAGHAHCSGWKVQESDWPDFAGHYPFAIHAASSAPPWTVGTNGVFVAQNCNGFYEAGPESCGCCKPCHSIQFSLQYREIKRTALAPMQPQCTMQHTRRTAAQMAQLADHHRAKASQLRLRAAATESKLAVSQRGLSMYQRFVVALSQEDVPRLRQLLMVHYVNQGRSMAFVLSKTAEAVASVYHPKVCSLPGFDRV
jgi:hypothetical protein